MTNSADNSLANRLESVTRTQEYIAKRNEVRGMGSLERFKRLKNARAMGHDWQSVYEEIRQMVDPMDCMSDTQIFGLEIPWDFWGE